MGRQTQAVTTDAPCRPHTRSAVTIDQGAKNQRFNRECERRELYKGYPRVDYTRIGSNKGKTPEHNQTHEYMYPSADIAYKNAWLLMSFAVSFRHSRPALHLFGTCMNVNECYHQIACTCFAAALYYKRCRLLPWAESADLKSKVEASADFIAALAPAILADLAPNQLLPQVRNWAQVLGMMWCMASRV